jgi:hypothetical protein
VLSFFFWTKVIQINKSQTHIISTFSAPVLSVGEPPPSIQQTQSADTTLSLVSMDVELVEVDGASNKLIKKKVQSTLSKFFKTG